MSRWYELRVDGKPFYATTHLPFFLALVKKLSAKVAV